MSAVHFHVVTALFFGDLKNQRLSPHTLKAYRLDLMDFLKHLSEDPSREGLQNIE
jgi:hypothetical protein